MFNSLPLIIQDYITNMSNKKTDIKVRFNYYTNLKNVRDEIDKHLKQFEKDTPKWKLLWLQINTLSHK